MLARSCQENTTQYKESGLYLHKDRLEDKALKLLDQQKFTAFIHQHANDMRNVMCHFLSCNDVLQLIVQHTTTFSNIERQITEMRASQKKRWKEVLYLLSVN